uniref:Uncharacterized protein n=1 Tax=Timema cristinae TaxID=61476 RepID=A0A7R9CKC4_TIMCR|nr:unnamed protein product [Timema cristinae]
MCGKNMGASYTTRQLVAAGGSCNEETRKQEDKSEEILSLHSQLATATSNLETREGVLSLKNQDIQKLIYSLKSVQTELTQLQNIHQECGNATLAIKQLNAAQDEVQALKAKITTFEAQEEPRKQEDKSEEILSLHSQLATATSNLKAREGVIANQEEMINILQESCKLHEKEIKELQTKTNKLVKEREQIDEEHKKLKYEYDGQKAQLLGLQEVLLATKQQLQDMQGKGYEVSVSRGWGWNHNDNQHTHIGKHHVHDTAIPLALPHPLLTAFEDPQRLHTCGDVLLVIALRSDDTILDR